MAPVGTGRGARNTLERQCSPPGAPPEIAGYVAPTELTPKSRAVVVSRFRIEHWIAINGAQRSRGHDVGKPHFIGSPSDRASWVKEHSVGDAVAAASFTTAGFAAGRRTLTYGQILRFPTRPAAVIRLLGLSKASPSERLNELSSLLQSLPLLRAARAAVFQALAHAPGIEDLGTTRDPLGRSGIAFGAPDERVPVTVNGPLTRLLGRERALHTRSELVFDPGTMALLAFETVLREPSLIPGISAGYPVSWTAYVGSRAVPEPSVPSLRALFGPHSSPTPFPTRLLGPAPIAGSHAPARARLTRPPTRLHP
ncbi:MAG: hypothetical protein M3071_13115 [Actinomycetota bacterium]|nr:hypothetical protein [Actinomycetota bacterium]